MDLDQIGLPQEVIVLYGAAWCPDCRRSKFFFVRNKIPYIFVDIELIEAARAFVERVNHGLESIPTILFPDGSLLVEPTDAQLKEKMGMEK